MKKLIPVLFITIPSFIMAQNNGGITKAMLQEMQKEYPINGADKALRNALAGNSINDLAVNADNPHAKDFTISNQVKSRGITNQERSGRCWLFTGLNVMRAQAIDRFHLGDFQFSQSYVFFYDQLEKSNLFLQAIIDHANEPFDSKLNTWLFQHPINDGGQFTGIKDLVPKYGLVPADVMPESYSANHTDRMSKIIALKLREYGLKLRQLANEQKNLHVIEQEKVKMLGTIYHILCLCLGTPPSHFTWTMRDEKGNAISTKIYTPQEFYKTYVGDNLQGGYVMLMNDPTRPYYKTYTIQLDRHVYDGENWTYINLPIEKIKKMAIASIKDNNMMYMSCDVGKFYNPKNGVLSLKNYDYENLFDTTFPMNKAERIKTFASASSHAMTLMGVDLDKNGEPQKWEVENSWGKDSGYKGHLIMTDKWFDEYMFRLVVNKKYVPSEILQLLQQQPVELPAWDPLFLPAE